MRNSTAVPAIRGKPLQVLRAHGPRWQLEPGASKADDLAIADVGHAGYAMQWMPQPTFTKHAPNWQATSSALLQMLEKVSLPGGCQSVQLKANEC